MGVAATLPELSEWTLRISETRHDRINETPGETRVSSIFMFTG